MKITVKVFQGQECSIEVTENTSVREIKQRVYETLNVPISEQKLLLCGRPLSDEKSVVDYPSMKEGTKLNLVIKKLENEEESNVLRTAVIKFLVNHFSEADTEKIAEEFMKEFNRSMSTLNLEDIEKIAASYLEEEKAGS